MENRTKQFVTNFSHQLEAIQVLCRTHGNRKPNDIKMLESVLANVEFVKRMKTKVPDNKLKTMLQHLKYRFHRKDEFVFYQAEMEDNFYILIYGKVEILLNKGEGAVQIFKKLKELKSGHTFGEFTFSQFGEGRKYAVRCIEDCHLAYLERKDFFELIQDLREQISKQISSLKQNPVFQYGWNQYDLMRFAISFTTNHYKRDALIYKEGEKDRLIYFLNSGEIHSFKRVKNDKLDANKNKFMPQVQKISKVSLSMWKEGAIFGDEEFMKIRKAQDIYSDDDVNKITREVSAIVNSAAAEVWVMEAELFFELLQQREEVYEDFVNVSNQKSKRRDKIFKQTQAINELDKPQRKPRFSKNDLSTDRSLPKLSPSPSPDNSLVKELSVDPQDLKAEVLEAHAKSPYRFDIVPTIPDFHSFDDRTLPPIRSKSLSKYRHSAHIEDSPPIAESITARPYHKRGRGSQEMAIDANKINFIKFQSELIEKKQIYEKMKRPDGSSKYKVRPLFSKEDLKLSKDNYLFVCGPQKVPYQRSSQLSPLRGPMSYKFKTYDTDVNGHSRFDSLPSINSKRINTFPESNHKKTDVSKREKSDFIRHKDTEEDHYIKEDSVDSKEASQDTASEKGDTNILEDPNMRTTKFSAIKSLVEDEVSHMKLPNIEKMIIIQPLSPDRGGHFLRKKALERRSADEIIHNTKNLSMEKLRKKSKRKKPSMNFHLNGDSSLPCEISLDGDCC